MFPDYLVIRYTLWISVLVLNSIAPVSILWTSLACFTWPAPPLVLIPTLSNADLIPYDRLLRFLTIWAGLESIWRVIHGCGRYLITRGFWEYKGEREKVHLEERWRLWRAMLECSDNPWELLGGMFLRPGAKTAPRGANDPNITAVKMEDVGRSNIAEFLAHYMFDTSLKAIRKDSLEAAEIHSMILLLEAKCQHKFKKGKSPHQCFLLYDQPIITSHHPLCFYVATSLASEFGSLAFWSWGFRYYGPRKTWPFPLFTLRSSRRKIDKRRPPPTALKNAEALSEVIGYWHYPGSAKAQKEGAMPVIFLHGISGSYGPALFIIFLQWMTGRPFFVPEMPYVFMRLAPPSMILVRPQVVAAARRMMHRHGYSLETTESMYDDSWKKGKAIILGHSLGGAPTSWLLRDAPDLVAGTLLLEPMNILLFAADPARNFFRTKCVSAGEIFFTAFTRERGISHYLSRHVRWTDSVAFGPKPVSPLPPEAIEVMPECAREPLEPPYDIPYYAPAIQPCPEGPFPTIAFYGEKDCILPVPKIEKYLLKSGFTREAVRIMPGVEHAGVLIRPGWAAEIAKAIDKIGAAAEAYAQAQAELDSDEESAADDDERQAVARVKNEEVASEGEKQSNGVANGVAELANGIVKQE